MMHSKLVLALAITSRMLGIAIAQDNGTDFGDFGDFGGGGGDDELALDPDNVQDASQEDGLDTAEEGESPSDT